MFLLFFVVLQQSNLVFFLLDIRMLKQTCERLPNHTRPSQYHPDQVLLGKDILSGTVMLHIMHWQMQSLQRQKSESQSSQNKYFVL